MRDSANPSNLPEPTEQKCPQCQATIPVYREFVIWCDTCNWNVKPDQVEQPKSLFEATYVKLGKSFGQQLFNQLVKTPSLKPSLTFSNFLAYSLAILVHIFTLVVAAGSIWLLMRCGLQLLDGVRTTNWPAFAVTLALGVVGILAIWDVIPEEQKLPVENIASRQQFPHLYATIADIAASLGTAGVDTILIDASFRASVTQMGWERKKVLRLGLPLFSILSPQEKVALLSHELAHYANGDTNRSLVVGSALHSLNSWYKLLHPDGFQFGNKRIGYFGKRGSGGVNLLGLFLAPIAYGGIFTLAHLMWRNSQRAEYLADALAAKNSSTPAVLSMLDKTQLRPAFDLSLQRFLAKHKNRSLFEDFQTYLAQMPPRELERIRRAAYLNQTRLDTTHPPTVYRLEFLRLRPIKTAQIVLTSSQNETLEQELVLAQAFVQEKLIEQHIPRIFR